MDNDLEIEEILLATIIVINYLFTIIMCLLCDDMDDYVLHNIVPYAFRTQLLELWLYLYHIRCELWVYIFVNTIW